MFPSICEMLNVHFELIQFFRLLVACLLFCLLAWFESISWDVKVDVLFPMKKPVFKSTFCEGET